MTKFFDRTGIRYGRLTALRVADEPMSGKIAWVCVCDCGNAKSVRGNSLTSGAIRSCGCMLLDGTHKMCGTRTYQSWNSMKQRCLNPKNPNFKYYGARGVTVCDRWVESFENFLADMGERPSGCSLDRIDGCKDYSPENCRWATHSQQSSNLSSNVLLTHNGETLTTSQWSRRIGSSNSLVGKRLSRGWTVADAVTVPSRKQGL